MAAATAFITFCTLLPFLPGRYDMLAVPLSLMAQVFGTIGLVLVPIVVLGVAIGYWSRRPGIHYGVAMVSLIASALVWIVVSLGAFATAGLALGVGALLFGIFVIASVW